MRGNISRVTLWSLVALVGALALPVAAQKESKAVAAARELDKQLIEAFNAKDVDKIMSLYWNSPELFSLGEGGQVTKGWEASKTATLGFLSAVETVQLATPECHYWESGNGILSACRYTFDANMKDGQESKSEGWYTSFRRRIGGKWLIVYDHVAQNTPPPPGPNESLYKRLGGYDALAAVSDDFLGRLAGDKQLGRFFQGVSKAHVQSIRQHVVDFLCMATGGPCVYVGQDMKSAHAGLGITGADWDRMVALLVETFDKFKVPDRERSEVLGALGGLKGDIVDKP